MKGELARFARIVALVIAAIGFVAWCAAPRGQRWILIESYSLPPRESTPVHVPGDQ